ncbi:MAG: hypothetical protein B7Y07_11595 [Halothiobacillus sp. 24-54-40]|jgi:hypothetical protein|nr:MAG: hypothetical protein B7Y58_11450 [Halothiobacillus sp. 35-54-62]OYY56714.1 MAG: hypothetical protein B7Y53_01195 [Halothiobacillus sp. 28-55-5]OYZ85368.1 MAG: hypothetical protein B7Y07_11595 [Halothiobacillus sp. 24-54-40]OZA79079.1 MAG: hypothetical protein B7X64_11180 [Halothiobacillus sp. 39-53-45]HQS02624.1 DUF4282 domain-containing protein [Halothiobacillus sp.]
MKDLLFFNSMLTPKIITVVYWLLLLGVVITGIGSMFALGGFSFGSFFKGLFMIVAGGIGVRIWSELMIVLFKINENMQKMADKS